MVLEPVTIPPNPYNLVNSEEDRVNLFQVLMDHTLNPSCPERAEAFRSYRCAKWSPKGAARANRCLLATLTMDHRLCIYEEKEKEWKCICDLTEEMQAERNARKEVAAESKQGRRKKKRREGKSKESRPRTRSRIQYLEEDSSDEEEEDAITSISNSLNYEELVERIYKLAAMEITWTGMFGSPATSINDTSYEYCYLIVAMKSGHIQFWKVSPSDGNVIALAHEWDTGLGLLTTLFWQQTSPTAGFLMCGTLKGILAFLPITVRVDSDQEPKVIVKNMCKVWDEEDHIAVDQIAVLKIALKKYVIIAAKQRALVGCEIALTDSSIIIRNVGHSFGLHNLPVTGMSVLDAAMPQYRVLIATMEGLLVEIKVSLGNDEIKFQHEKVGIDLDLKNMMIQGLAVSSNGLLCSLILNTASYFDHLAKKEGLQFVMFITRPFEVIYTKLKSVLKPQFSFSPITSGSVSKHTDFFECVRISLACGTSLPDWLTAFLDNDPMTYENASAMELYCMR
ncbi:uncharacterized protein LOC118201244 isoform X1 [Stegodyphus dumicola]|uniref:uncharacterized protein LOC118201244 isoform X1 n=1 Tax=Stegodyphus dumicola TaxID=202533 RepID=UPI0015AA3432|nr:uncharacterized protein LOC118201244 isoform X1 [Stegodyphus dumicola]